MKYRKSERMFAINLFDDRKMKKYLPHRTYKAIVSARENLTEVPERDRNAYAKILCRWALKKGATRYTHWFQPLNNRTAGKRESLYSIDNRYSAVLKFRGKELEKGEGDASSFPSGGMRTTFEARGLTKWDYTSYPFVKDGCLFIPCTFAGAHGEALDKKTPLIKSCKALDVQAVRVLKALGENVKHVYGAVGVEQEYFLVDKSLFAQREDLVYTGRTLFGEKPPKGQEFDDHYFCPPNDKIVDFMQEVDNELWKLGILAKTEHNEVAPRQYELALCYTRANIAADQNQLVMEILKRTANKYGLTCLLHEKPFVCFNGSGKHNNWSMLSDKDENLLEPGKTPRQNVRFLLMLAAVVKAVDEYSELLMCAISSRANDCRLGGFEAPKNVLTVFLGKPLNDAIAFATSGKWRYGVDILPKLPQNTDRNRTSPFAYTGNKFEFRSMGASASVADVNTALHTAVAESLKQFADRLERSPNVMSGAAKIVSETFAKHKKVIFDGDNYSEEWGAEAKMRNLKNCCAIDAAEALSNAHNINLMERHGVLTHKELLAGQKIMLENYVNTVRVEGNVAINIYKQKIFYAAENYINTLTCTARNKGASDMDCRTENALAETLSMLVRIAENRMRKLKKRLESIPSDKSLYEQACYCKEAVLPALDSLRIPIDKMETLCPKDVWPLPTYGQLLFDVN